MGSGRRQRAREEVHHLTVRGKGEGTGGKGTGGDWRLGGGNDLPPQFLLQSFRYNLKKAVYFGMPDVVRFVQKNFRHPGEHLKACLNLV